MKKVYTDFHLGISKLIYIKSCQPFLCKQRARLLGLNIINVWYIKIRKTILTICINEFAYRFRPKHLAEHIAEWSYNQDIFVMKVHSDFYLEILESIYIKSCQPFLSAAVVVRPLAFDVYILSNILVPSEMIVIVKVLIVRCNESKVLKQCMEIQ